MSEPVDRSDPGVRAAAALRRRRQRDEMVRLGVGSLLVAVAVIGTILTASYIGELAIAVGLAGLALCAVAYVIWPWTWSPAELRHWRLDAIWHEARREAPTAPWKQYVAWAEADDGNVRLMLLCRNPRAPIAAQAPSPYAIGRRVVVDPEDVGDAAVAMEKLRAEAERLEEAARRRHLADIASAEVRRDDEALAAVERQAAAEQQEAERRMRAELAAERKEERRAQADAVARSLRKP